MNERRRKEQLLSLRESLRLAACGGAARPIRTHTDRSASPPTTWLLLASVLKLEPVSVTPSLELQQPFSPEETGFLSIRPLDRVKFCSEQIIPHGTHLLSSDTAMNYFKMSQSANLQVLKVMVRMVN